MSKLLQIVVRLHRGGLDIIVTILKVRIIIHVPVSLFLGLLHQE